MDPCGFLVGSRSAHPSSWWSHVVLVFQQNGRYGVIDFLNIDASGNLDIRYWLAAPGVVDFSNAP